MFQFNMNFKTVFVIGNSIGYWEFENSGITLSFGSVLLLVLIRSMA
jgi:hypothetical protein